MSIPNSATRLVALLALCAGLTGCASKPPPKAPPPPPPPPATLSQIKQDLSSAKAQLGMTTASLNALAKASPADAQMSYNRFSSEFANLEVMVQNNRSRVQDLKVRSREYFDTWTKESTVSNPDLQRRLMQQRADAEKTCSTIKNELELGKLAFDPYMANLKDVQTYLRGDLSPARIGTASDLIAKASDDGKSVEKHIDAVLVEIDKMIAASGGGAPR